MSILGLIHGIHHLIFWLMFYLIIYQHFSLAIQSYVLLHVDILFIDDQIQVKLFVLSNGFELLWSFGEIWLMQLKIITDKQFVSIKPQLSQLERLISCISFYLLFNVLLMNLIIQPMLVFIDLFALTFHIIILNVDFRSKVIIILLLEWIKINKKTLKD